MRHKDDPENECSFQIVNEQHWTDRFTLRGTPHSHRHETTPSRSNKAATQTAPQTWARNSKRSIQDIVMKLKNPSKPCITPYMPSSRNVRIPAFEMHHFSSFSAYRMLNWLHLEKKKKSYYWTIYSGPPQQIQSIHYHPSIIWVNSSQLWLNLSKECILDVSSISEKQIQTNSSTWKFKPWGGKSYVSSNKATWTTGNFKPLAVKPPTEFSIFCPEW